MRSVSRSISALVSAVNRLTDYHAGNVVDVLDVVDVTLEVDQAFFQRDQVFLC